MALSFSCVMLILFMILCISHRSPVLGAILATALVATTAYSTPRDAHNFNAHQADQATNEDDVDRLLALRSHSVKKSIAAGEPQRNSVKEPSTQDYNQALESLMRDVSQTLVPG